MNNAKQPSSFTVAYRAGPARLYRWTSSPHGRLMLRVLSRTRVVPYDPNQDDLSVDVAAIAPGFVIVAHDPHEAIFGPEHAEAIYGWAGEPKQLWWLPGADTVAPC